MRRLPLVLLLASCNSIYGLEATRVVDAALPDALAPLVTPPPGPTTCGPMPDFEAWTYARQDLPPTPDIFDLSPYRDRAIVTANNATELWDVALDGTDAVPLTQLPAPPAAAFRDPAMAPDGSALWFRQDSASQGTFYATRGSGWQKVRESFGYVDPFELQIGSPGFFDGTLRIPALLQRESGDTRRIVELSSPDGRAWTELSTSIDFAGIGGLIGAPRLSADGCLLFFGVTQAIPYSLYVVRRDDQRRFTGMPLLLSKATNAGRYAGTPVLAPDGLSLWFRAEVDVLPAGTAQRLVRGK